MKKVVYLVLFLIMAGTTVHAQYFAGGSFNFSTTGGKIKSGDISTDKGTSTSFSLNPKGGIFLSEDFAVGLGIGINTSREKSPGETEVIDKSMGFGIQPFARYYVVSMNKFTLFGEGQLGFSSAWSKVESGGTTTDGPVTNTIEFSVYPGISYDLNEKIDLEAFINGFNMSYSHATEKTDAGGTEVRDRTSSFNLGANMDNILTSGAVTVGVIVKL
ncbi:MAG: hypothetical protein ACLFM7_10575 [Bacteroidales bacterium]